MVGRRSAAAGAGRSESIDYDGLFSELTDDEGVRTSLATFRREKAELAAVCEQEAATHQKAHTGNVIVAGVFGTVAVVCAIVQLSGRFASVPFWFELAAVIVACVAVGRGVLARRHHSWLLQRHKAERCHLLSWRLLTDPMLWDRENEKAQKAAVDEALTQLAALRQPTYQFDQWLEESDIPVLPTKVGALPPPSLRKIYLDFRLRDQQRYFARAWRRNERLQRWSKPVALVAFCGSALIGLAHFGVDLYHRLGHVDEEVGAATGVSLSLLLASASLPVLAGAVRVIRDAFEPARNTARFRHHERELAGLISRVQPTSDATLAGELWVSEFVLESEHRAWLLLMMEAEWFG